MRRTLAALVAAVLLAIPATAYAQTKVGGQSSSAVGCDVTLVSFTVDPMTGDVSFDAGSADCDFQELYETIRRALTFWS